MSVQTRKLARAKRKLQDAEKRLINKPQLYGCNGSSREPSFGPLTGPGGGPRLRSKRL